MFTNILSIRKLKNQIQQRPTNIAGVQMKHLFGQQGCAKGHSPHFFFVQVLPVPQHVGSYRAEPANSGLTPKAVDVVAGVDAVLDEDCLHSLSSPAPPAGEKPASVPPPQPAALSLLPWLTVLHGHGTPPHLLLVQPMTIRGTIHNPL